jgi:hypothetical protein
MVSTNRSLMTVNGIPVVDAAIQLQLELQMMQSRLRSDAASVCGHTFESYEDTLKWVVAHCSSYDWQYVMDMPALCSLVRPDVQFYKVLLEEESHSSKTGYAYPPMPCCPYLLKPRSQKSLEGKR